MGLTKRVIPCIDVDIDDDGQAAVYTGTNFENLQYTGDPAEMAQRYNEAGADEFVFLDITASAEGRETMLDVVSSVADEVFIPLTVGGGIRTRADVKETLRAGADKVSINTGAMERPELITEGARAFGNQCIVVSVDARRREDDGGTHYVETQDDGEVWWECTVKGGREGTGRDVIEWAAEAEERGAGELFINSIDADGTREGYDLPLLRAVCETVSTPVIASSGCGSPQHMYEAFEVGADAALAASIFHQGDYSIAETKAYLADKGVPIRR
ncbi:MAG: imidazole glycerol phosphate synthase subunit HisF [Halobacteriaceae archaeon]